MEDTEMTRRLLFFWLVLGACGSPCLAQVNAKILPVARNAVYFELLGNGGLFSFNFERMLTDHVAVRAGYARWNLDSAPLDTGQYQTVPMTVSYLCGGGERKLELGGGVTIGKGQSSDSSDNFSFSSLTAILGYRSQPAAGGYLFRAGLTPFYTLNDGETYPGEGFTFSAGVSFGYRF
jgi:hypothetical protein